MTPKDIFTNFFKAIEKRDFASIKKFLPASGPLAVVLSDGTVIDEAEDFIEFFEDWFDDADWSIKHKIAHVEEVADMAYGVVECDYAGKDDAGVDYSVTLFTTAIIRKIEGQWQIVHFQQTEGFED